MKKSWTPPLRVVLRWRCLEGERCVCKDCGGAIEPVGCECKGQEQPWPPPVRVHHVTSSASLLLIRVDPLCTPCWIRHQLETATDGV